MGVRRTIGCLLLILLLTAGVGGSYVWYLWTRTDELLHGRIASALRETVPEWNIGFSRARFDFQGQIRIYDFVVTPPKQQQVMLNLPETVISVDRDQLAAQRLVFQQIRLVQPELDLIRDPAGIWNCLSLGPLPETQANLPEWVIERGTVRLQIQPKGGGGATATSCRNVHLRLTPSGKRRYHVKGTVLVDKAGTINVEGHWHLDSHTWQLTGDVENLKFGKDVWDQLCEFWPSLQDRMAELPNRLGYALPGPPITDPRLNAVGDLFFRLGQTEKNGELDYRVLVNVHSGQWTHPLCPYPLDDVQGQFSFDRTQVSVPALSARHGNLEVKVRNGRLDRTQPHAPITVLVGLKDLPLEARTRSRLTPHLRHIFDELRPNGRINLNMHLTYSREAGLKVDSDLIPAGCSISHIKFPYPIENLRGIVRKRGHVVKLDLEGTAGQRTVVLKGESDNEGEDAGGTLDVTVDDLPIDDVLTSACPLAARKTLQALALQGLLNVHFHFTRVGGEEGPHDFSLSATLRSGSMNYHAFPYGITDLQGMIDYSGGLWTFSKLRGVHGSTSLTGEGQYQHSEQSSVLGMTITAKDANLDQELELALPEDWQKTWREFSPTGKINCVTQIDWVPGHAPEIAIDANLHEATIQLKSFPYPIEHLTGRVTFQRDPENPQMLRADLHNILGRHEDTRLNLINGYALLEPNGQWRVRLDDFEVEDLSPNNRFRRALPTGFREVIDTLDPRDGSVALAGMLEFRGTENAKDGVTSAWDLEILCTGTTITTGIDLKHLYGKFFIKGTWDGKIISTSGWSDLTSLTILGYQFANVKGPITIVGNQLIIGSRDVVNAQRQQSGVSKRPPPEQRITGRAIQGVFTLDGIAVLGQETSYRVVLTMRDALLERYAELYLPNQHDLRGIMTGEAELSGRGNSARNLKGGGQLLIRPAALYQLPVMLAVLKQLNGGSPNNTAFDEAQAFFEIDNGCFVFRQVDLKGAALNLRGFGKVYFNRRLSFDFFSTVPRARAPLAILQQVVGQATVGLMGVEVRGTLDNPVAKIRPAQRLDDAFRNFLGGLDPNRTQMNGQNLMPFGPSTRRPNNLPTDTVPR